MISILIGIDDTDNKESRGTGFQARQLGQLIEKEKLGVVQGITRHQLFVHPDIPYTSQNSSACLLVETAFIDPIVELTREFLLEIAAVGSDVGMCIAMMEEIGEEVIKWGNNAKSKVLRKDEASLLANKEKIILEGLTGTNDGIIGALAAIGLRKEGNDGRFIWLKGKEIRDLHDVYSVQELLDLLNADKVIDRYGNSLKSDARIHIGEWLRPLLKGNKVIIIADKAENETDYEWKVTSKEYIKSLSN